MAKPNDWNSDVVKGVEVVSRVLNGVVSFGTTAVPISSEDTDINWIILFNLGTATVYIGNSTVTATGSTRGLPMRPNGETPKLKVDSLNVLYLISGSASQEVAYLAGVK